MKSKSCELLDGRQPTGAHRRLQPPVVAQLNLRGEQLLDRIGRGQRAAVDVAQDRVERFQGAGHAQVGQDLPEAITARERGGLHARPPVSWA